MNLFLFFLFFFTQITCRSWCLLFCWAGRLQSDYGRGGWTGLQTQCWLWGCLVQRWRRGIKMPFYMFIQY